MELKFEKVEQLLPSDGARVLAVIEGYWQDFTYPPGTVKVTKLVEARFHRRYGWEFINPFEHKHTPVVAWTHYELPPEYRNAMDT